MVLFGEQGAQKRLVVHEGAAILTAVSDGRTMLTGGDDGLVTAIGDDGVARGIADERGTWIDALAHARTGFRLERQQAGQRPRREWRSADMEGADQRARSGLPA